MQEDEIKIFTDPPVVYAAFWQRVLAFFIDGIVISLLFRSILFFFLIRFIDSEDDITFSTYVALINMLTSVIYYAILESSKKQATIGKMALKIKVTDLDGNRISFLTAVGRFFGKVLSTVLFFIGFLVMLWDDKKQCLHDRISGTLVVRS